MVISKNVFDILDGRMKLKTIMLSFLKSTLALEIPVRLRRWFTMLKEVVAVPVDLMLDSFARQLDTGFE